MFNNERVRLATITLSVLNNKEAIELKSIFVFLEDSFLLIYFHSRTHLKFYKKLLTSFAYPIYIAR